MNPVRTWFATLLIIIGALWLADAAGLLDAGQVIGTWWPLALVLLAVITVAVDRRITPGPVVLLLIGTLLLVSRTTGADAGAVVAASAAILLGAWLLVQHTRRVADREGTGGRGTAGGSTLAVFSGARQVVHSDHFRHADVSAVFGGAT